MRMAGWVGVSATDEGSRSDLAVSITGDPNHNFGHSVMLADLASHALAEPALAKLLAQFFQGTPQVRVPRPIDPDYKPSGCPSLDALG